MAKNSALRGNRLSDGQPLTIYPGEVPARLPAAFWQQQDFSLKTFVRRSWMSIGLAAHSSRRGAGILIGDKLR